MRIIPLALLASIIIYSCKEKSSSSPAPATVDTTAIPQALQDEKKSREYSKSSRGSGDLVEELYDELKDQTPALQQLEESINRVKEQKEDSAEAFNEYNQKNTTYYGSANQHLRAINDSLVRERIRTLITKSMLSYENRAAANKDLLALVNKKDVTVNDLYIVLKLTKTVEMIEKFQRNNLPPTRPLEKVSRDYDKVITQL